MTKYKTGKILPCKLIPHGCELIRNNQDNSLPIHHSIIVTRYFLKNSGSNELTDVDEWFEERNKLFEKYTLPSVINQSLKPQAWYIYIETGFESKLPNSLTNGGFDIKINIVSINSNNESYSSAISRAINNEKNISEFSEVITCTRIDNDDAFEADFLLAIDTIARNGTFNNDCIVTLPIGAQLDTKTNEINLYVFTNNHFLTSFHRKNEILISHVHSFDHTFTFNESREVEIVCTSQPMWLEVVHGSNLRNRFKQGLPKISLNSESGIADKKNNHFGEEFQIELIKRRMKEIQSFSNAMKPPEYFDAYAKLLHWKKIDSMLEIGIHKGGSLKFWRQFIGENSKIYGIDIDPNCLNIPNIGATEILIGSQADVVFLNKIKEKWGQFDLVIDDGSHIDSHMQISLEVIFPSLKSGGVYIVEDMFTSYWSNWGGGYLKADSFVEKTKNRIDLIFHKYMTEKYAKHHNIANDIPCHDKISESIDSIHFFKCGITAFVKN